jgi:catechol 2,3-dioxygenase-like lactoylglutathione lyase family enzyme
MAEHGIHHVTAIAGDARRNRDFYSRVLGLRLVKKTVNFDDPRTYHLYYRDETGRPGTILTFFPWAQAAPGRAGVGFAQQTGLRPGGFDRFLEPSPRRTGRRSRHPREALRGDRPAVQGPGRPGARPRGGAGRRGPARLERCGTTACSSRWPKRRCCARLGGGKQLAVARRARVEAHLL